ncbi:MULTISPECIES: PQQ-dependent sugar dehydrogenase [unclassified Arcicella]|uniref:PQQ-dependent sugar dehydrogenase n=1 Tax=unclassified Arcicella TaxID=2644986 RepID=UPI002858424B|nr:MULTISPECIES: PQQ-dependent sugar dehydrogenase [unclassified Arcicella]MDR6563534.1 glucose/arabinose dehydrogenase [Arcicella sp. BE51]MDR6813354.1 glucose/arabinose dehydrogenase [Arcicella sp. BE140]MDR6824667.1 glucose/arabinose dehydrogenase [Arcicella sp. BE139]
MKNSILTLMIAAGIAFGSCKCDLNAKQETGIKTDSLPPVETNAANSNYKPAFAGQTRIKGVKTTTSYESKILTTSLQSPWGITSLPDGRLLITEKAGTMRIVTIDGQVSQPITGIPTVNASGQGGLLGVRIDPNFATNRMVYWVFSQPNADGNLTAVCKGKLSANERTIESPTVIYRATPAYNGTLHYGGRIVFDQAGNLLVSTGERSDLVTRPQAQALNSGLGKIIRITKDGTEPSGNPFVGQVGARTELYAYGFRNPQGLAIHPVTGELWESEHGPRGGDEINRVRAGANYGWPTITYGIEYSGEKVGSGIQQQSGLEQPIYYWDPVVSPSGITFYSSDRIPEWKNNLFVGALSGMHIVRLVIESNKVVGEERLLASESQRFRDITQGTDGALYAITDQGRLYRIDKK